MRLNAMLEKVPGIESTFYEREQVQRERKRRKGGGEQGGKEERQGNASERGRRTAGRKGVLRNILASPRVPSCVLNHFPVDSAVCNPIIGVSPPGKLLFYSRTTRAPDVPRCSFSLFLSLFLLLLLPVFVSLFFPASAQRSRF